MASILLVEDDASVRESISMALRGHGHEVRTASTGDEALATWQQYPLPELVLLDVMLPGTDGVAVCRAIRRQSQLPIVMLTARSDPFDMVTGLESGADDYVTKPFETSVLLARMNAVLRRASSTAGAPVIEIGDLEIDEAGMSVRRSGEPVHLTPTELRLLLELARRPGRVHTRAELLQLVWEYDYLGDSRLVDVCVQRLRAKVEANPANPTLVCTVRGIGYKLSHTT